MTSLLFILYLFTSTWWGYTAWLKMFVIMDHISNWRGLGNSKEFWVWLRFFIIEIVKLLFAIILFLTQIFFFYAYFENYCAKALPTLVV